MPTEKRLSSRIVPPEGPLDAKICFIGEAPGEEEDGEGRPFVGSAGVLLNRCLNHKHILRSEVLLWNVFSQRPPRNNINYYFSDKMNRKPTWEGETHIENLRQWLLKVKPNLVVALGAVPLYALAGKKRILKWRGSVLPCTLVPGLKVYATYHPSYVNRLMNEQQETKLYGEKKKQAENVLPVFLRDLERIKEQSEFPDIRQPERRIEVDLGLEEILSRLHEWTKDETSCAVDIETLPSPTGPVVWCIGFSPSPDYAMVIPIIRNQRFAWSEDQEIKIWQAVSDYFLSNAKKIFQGGLQYDLPVLGRYYGLRVRKGTLEDTMWCHHASYPYIRKGLHVLTSIYTWEPYYKDEGKVHFGKRGSDTAEFLYNGKDCCCTREIFPILARDARELGTWDGYRRTIDCGESHLAMTLRGVRIDVSKKERLAIEFEKTATDNATAVNQLVGDVYNLNSHDQKRKLLYGYLGLDIQYNRSTGKVTVDQEALQKLAKKYPPSTEGGRIVRHIIDYQKFAVLSRNFAQMELDSDGRVRTSYGYVSTWRTSSSGSPFVLDLSKKSEAGGNLQNIPVRSEEGKMIRTLFIPDEGKELLACDLKQAEAMFVAWDSEDLELIEMFLDGTVDVHWEYTKSIFNMPKDIKYLPKALFKDKYTQDDHTLYDLRRLGKTTRHATNYDMGPYKFQAILVKEGFHLPFGTCKQILASAKNKTPALAMWKRWIREELKATRTLITPLGRKREFRGRLNDDTFRAAYAFRPQSTVGEILQIAIQRIYSELPYVDVLLNVHDEVVTQIDPRDRARAIVDIKSRMEVPLEIKGRTLVIPCEFKVGPSWGEMEEIHEL